MTEKRFNLVGSYLYDDDECVSHFDDLKHREEIVNLLNELSDENEQLKHDATVLISSNSDYRKENEQLKAQLYYRGDSVCSICEYQKLLKSDIDGYYTAKCKKGHEECSKIDLNYCEDFELVGDYK